MVVVIAKYLPDAIRGIIKLWFIEVKPNVFISGINDSTANKVVDHLIKSCKPDSGLIIFQSHNFAPFHKIRSVGYNHNQIIDFNGLHLIKEKSGNL